MLLAYPQKVHRQVFSIWYQSIFLRQTGQVFFLPVGWLLGGEDSFFDFWYSLEDKDAKGTESKIGSGGGLGLGALGGSLFSSVLP